MPASDVVILSALVVSFAVFVTAHVAVSFSLVRRRPRWRGPLALLVAPLAPYWGLKSGLKSWSALWLASVGVYAAARIAAALAV